MEIPFVRYYYSSTVLSCTLKADIACSSCCLDFLSGAEHLGNFSEQRVRRYWWSQMFKSHCAFCSKHCIHHIRYCSPELHVFLNSALWTQLFMHRHMGHLITNASRLITHHQKPEFIWHLCPALITALLCVNIRTRKFSIWSFPLERPEIIDFKAHMVDLETNSVCLRKLCIC